jgi:hypothetical protein
MSVVYFMEHGHKLPEEARKVAAANLTRACLEFSLQPPELLEKVAAGAKGHLVDVTGATPSTIFERQMPKTAAEYAVTLPDGRNLYPIDSWDRVKQAESYFLDHAKEMDPAIRRQFATKLAARAEVLGCPIDDNIRWVGAKTYAPTGVMKVAVEMRKAAMPEARKELDEIFEKRATLSPERYAVQLLDFDTRNYLDRLWGTRMYDPWQSTFGLSKTAEVLWEQGAERVTEEELMNLARNHAKVLSQTFTPGFTEAFQKDPVGIFNSMPTPQKVILARMANASSFKGESEFSTSASTLSGMAGVEA